MKQRAKRILMTVMLSLGVAFGLVAAVMKLIPATGEGAVALLVLFIVFGALGLCFLLAAVCIGLLWDVGERRRAALCAMGRPAQAVVEQIGMDERGRVNGRAPFVVTASCVHPVTGEEVLVHSHHLWQRPALKAGDKVTVYFDAVKERRYAFDLRDEKKEL